MAVDSGSISIPGAPNADTTTPRALRLAEYSGRTLAAFDRATRFRTLVMSMPMMGTQTFQFPAIGRIGSQFHVAGNHVFDDGEGGAFNHVKRTIDSDDELVAATFVDKLEPLETEYPFIGIYLNKIGEELARQYEEFAFTAAIRAARHQSGNTTDLIPDDTATDGTGVGGFVGSVDITSGTTPAENGAKLLEALFSASQVLDEKEVPDDDGTRWSPQRVANYNLLVQNRELIDRDYGNAGNGIFYNGTVFVGAGFGLFKSNRIPNTNVATNPAGARNTYTGDFTEVHCVAIHSEVIACPTIQAPMLETQYDLPRRGNYLIGSTVQGCGPMRYECAVEISSAASQPAL